MTDQDLPLKKSRVQLIVLWALYLSLGLGFPLTPIVRAEQATSEPAIRVMSFNLRFATANDGDNRWELRRDLLLRTIQQFNPDLLGTQETLPIQAEFLGHALPQYEYWGRSREADENSGGEQSGLFFRKDRFRRVDQGHFWLSESPEAPGSKSWDTSLPRMVTWVELEDTHASRRLRFYNTHFDHLGSMARLESARLLRRRIAGLPASTPTIVTGDFNCGADSEPYQALFGPGENRLQDTYRIVHGPSREKGTFHAFRGEAGERRIDWVAVTSNWRVRAAEIDLTHDGGRYPSDHFPVQAVVEWP